MFGRTRFQQGSLQRERRKKGPVVWVFRWYETMPDGKRKRQYRAIGTVEEYPTESAAACAADSVGYSSTVPIARYWRLRFPSGMVSYQRKTQTTGPFLRRSR